MIIPTLGVGMHPLTLRVMRYIEQTQSVGTIR